MLHQSSRKWPLTDYLNLQISTVTAKCDIFLTCIVGFKNPSFMGTCLEMKGVKDDAILKPLYSKTCLSWTKDFGYSCLDRFKSKILLEITIH